MAAELFPILFISQTLQVKPGQTPDVCYQVGIIINDRVDVALASGAHGVHVGQDDLPAKAARNLLGPNKILGVSVKTVEQALQAAADGADYLRAGASKLPFTTVIFMSIKQINQEIE